MVQQQAAMLSFVEAFWVMGVIFWGMAPLVVLLRNPRELHPHVPKAKRARAVELVPEPIEELVGLGQ